MRLVQNEIPVVFWELPCKMCSFSIDLSSHLNPICLQEMTSKMTVVKARNETEACLNHKNERAVLTNWRQVKVLYMFNVWMLIVIYTFCFVNIYKPIFPVNIRHTYHIYTYKSPICLKIERRKSCKVTNNKPWQTISSGFYEVKVKWHNGRI